MPPPAPGRDPRAGFHLRLRPALHRRPAGRPRRRGHQNRGAGTPGHHPRRRSLRHIPRQRTGRGLVEPPLHLPAAQPRQAVPGSGSVPPGRPPHFPRPGDGQRRGNGKLHPPRDAPLGTGLPQPPPAAPRHHNDLQHRLRTRRRPLFILSGAGHHPGRHPRPLLDHRAIPARNPPKPAALS